MPSQEPEASDQVSHGGHGGAARSEAERGAGGETRGGAQASLGPPRGHELALAWLAFTFLALGVSPAHFWLDSGEIASAGAVLGVMHPTGVPGYIPLLHLATALPLGSLGLRMALVSSACMTGAIALLLATLRRRGVHWALLWVVGLWLPLSLTLARNARVVEIYGFAALLLMATLWGFDPAIDASRRLSRRCIGVFAAVIAAWGFGDLRLALAPAVVLAWILAWRRAEPWARWAPLCVALASLVVLTLPLASARNAIADWGDPQTWPAIWAHVQAAAIRDSFAVKLAGMSWRAWLLHARLVATRLVEDLGPFGLLGAVAALGFGLTRPLSLAARERKQRSSAPADEPRSSEAQARAASFVDDDHRLLRWVGWIGLVELIYAVAINPMGGRDRQTGLALGLLAALALALGLRRLFVNRPLLRWVMLPLLAFGLWLPAAFESLADVRATRSWAPHAWTREVLARTPTDALVLSQSDDLSAGLSAARALEGARPDLVAVPAQHLYREPSPWQRGTARRAAVWEAAATADGETARVAAVLSRWRGAVVLESPTTAALAGIALPGEGEPPIWIAELPPPADALPPSVPSPGDPLGEAIARWQDRLDNPIDRERLADALALWITGEFSRAPESPVRWLKAGHGYRRILDEVLPDHPRSLIGLGAMRDRFGETREAIELTRRALELDPQSPTALANLALYLSRDPATLAEARDLAELAVELAADRRNVWRQLLLVCRAQADTACIQRAEDALDRGG
jgi:tetratricopeptide (TPR) repeat protein